MQAVIDASLWGRKQSMEAWSATRLFSSRKREQENNDNKIEIFPDEPQKDGMRILTCSDTS